MRSVLFSIFISFFLCFCQSFVEEDNNEIKVPGKVKAEEKNSASLKFPSIPLDVLEENIVKFLRTVSFEPYLNHTEAKIQLNKVLQPDINTHEMYANFVEVNLEDQSTSLSGVFLVKYDKNVKIFYTYLLYITENMRALIDPVLFYDINNAIERITPRLAPPRIVYIDSKRKDNNLSVWTYSSQQRSYSFKVTLFPDGQGGNYFNIKQIE
ncbi:MAG: hypothetical protein CMP11_02035 [Zetaproteobacteria bacterium]|nr:hypothetical protein [Pseudobdellovibrionaceae bacterium]|tara:strand:+ start:961 stop:1590 length:630 start_codon:yes stop_codon:yes gene_type:complete